MQENTDDKDDLTAELPDYSLKHSNIASYIAVGQGDLKILWMYKHLFKKPMLAVLHYMVGTAARCWEERHVRKIKEMEERLRINEEIIKAYIRKFGRIRPH